MAVVINTQSKQDNLKSQTSTNKTSDSMNKTLQLGPRKSVTIHPWKAKAKKDFIKVFKKKGKNVSERDVLDVLVYPYIEEKIFLNSAEVQYILTELRKISIKDQNIEFILTCDKCTKEFDVETNIDNLVHYKETLIPIKDDNIEWKEVSSLKELENNLKKFSEEPPSIINMAMNIKNYNGNEIDSIEKFIEIYDDMSMGEVDIIETRWKEVSSNFEIYQELECPHCKYKTAYLFDIIPSFFDPLLPKE